MIVIHYTGMQSAQVALDRLCDPASRVSAHFFIDEDGSVLELVAPAKRAWHAGISAWAGRHRLNDVSIGIELVNPGHEWGYRAFPPAQMTALIDLVRQLKRKWRIPRNRIVGHSDIAPARKTDPGELFDWPRLAAHGLAIGPPVLAARRDGLVEKNAVPELKRLLNDIGYSSDIASFSDIVIAFKRRFLPSDVSGDVSVAAQAAIRAIHRQHQRL